MFDADRLQRVSIKDFLDSPQRSVEFSTEFAAQFFELPSGGSASRPDHGYVELDKVIRITSILGFLLGTYSLILWSISGFALIHPLFSALTIVAAGTFYCMGLFLRRPQKRK
jgi:hypothetical protein